MTVRIEVDLRQGMNTEEYVTWIITNTARELIEKPEEKEITLRVYGIHRSVLGKTEDLAEETLRECDEAVLTLMRKQGYEGDISIEDIRRYIAL